MQVLFDGHLSSSVVFSYNAKAVDGQLCLEASPNENQSYFAHSPHATLLEVRNILNGGGIVPYTFLVCHSGCESNQNHCFSQYPSLPRRLAGMVGSYYYVDSKLGCSCL